MTPSKEDAPTPMTPYLARNDESPQDLQNRQGTPAAASTSAVSPSTIAAAATATHHCHNDWSSRRCRSRCRQIAEEDHGDGEVGDADPVHDESAEENTIVLSKSFNWIIKGVEELDEGKIRHMNAFYALLKKWMIGKEYTSKLIVSLLEIQQAKLRAMFLIIYNTNNKDITDPDVMVNVSFSKQNVTTQSKLQL